MKSQPHGWQGCDHWPQSHQESLQIYESLWTIHWLPSVGIKKHSFTKFETENKMENERNETLVNALGNTSLFLSF